MTHAFLMKVFDGSYAASRECVNSVCPRCLTV